MRALAANHPYGAQLRAARGLLNISVAELSRITNLAVNTIKRAEATNGPAPITAANAALLVATLEERGIVFIVPESGLGPGARLASAD